MADLTTYIAVTTSGSDLDLNDGVAYTVATREFNAGTVAHRRVEAKSPFMHGSVFIDAVKDNTTMTLPIHVLGATMSAVQTNIDALIDAVDAIDYDLKVAFEGRLWTFDCGPADYDIGFVTGYLNNLIVPMTLSIPRQPNFTTGTYP